MEFISGILSHKYSVKRELLFKNLRQVVTFKIGLSWFKKKLIKSRKFKMSMFQSVKM